MERKIAREEVFLRALLFFAFVLIALYVPAKSQIEANKRYEKLHAEYTIYKETKTSQLKKLEERLHYEQKLKRSDVQQQLSCLADNIYYEAGHEPYEGKLAVATVTMNRVESKQFPKTVCGVVYQKNRGTCQFSWTCQERKKKDPSAFYEARKIAEKVLLLNHRSSIITPRVMFYHAHYVSPGWANRMHLEKVIGAHLFYRTY